MTPFEATMKSEHFVADIPVKALIARDGKVLAVKDEIDRWGLPGGRLHKEEMPVDGLRREVMEELNLDVIPGEIIHAVPFVSQKGVPHFAVIFACTLVSSFDDHKLQPDEIHEVAWLGPNDFEDLFMWDWCKETLRKYFATQ